MSGAENRTFPLGTGLCSAKTLAIIDFAGRRGAADAVKSTFRGGNAASPLEGAVVCPFMHGNEID